MARRRTTPLIPRLLALAGVSALIASYLPLTGLDHLHLHVAEGIEFVHDHVHVGRHEHPHHDGHGHHGHHHDHHHPAAPEDRRDDEPGDEGDDRSTVVTYIQAAQVRPPAIEMASQLALVLRTTGPRADRLRRAEAPQPPWSPRAPPPA